MRPEAGNGWVAAPLLQVAGLTGTSWQFETLGGQVFRAFLVLAPDGRVGNYRHRNEDTWQVIDGRLAFLTIEGRPSVIYDSALVEGARIEAMAGKALLPGFERWHCLRRATPPDLSGTQANPGRRQARWLERLDAPKRSNLVVLRAGERSLHTGWSSDFRDGYRSWDLCISYYGRNPGDLTEAPEYLTHQPQQRKFQALYDLFYSDSPLWEYERIWLPDDDLSTTSEDIDRAFHLSRKHGLHLAQPALRRQPDCHINHPITAQEPDSVLRFTSFVEIMCPLFSRDGLRVCVGTFRDSLTGFGLDHLWPALLGWPETAVAIIDEVGLVHTRPFAQNYDIYAAMGEEWRTHAAYQFGKSEPREIARLRR